MAKVARDLLQEAFVDPIRFALLVDDQFPVYPILTHSGPDAALDNDRARALFNFCRAQGWLCDVDNGISVAERFEQDKHLHQSDLLVLDFNLNPTDQTDPSAALKILQRLATSAHFNLVVVYTGEPTDGVARDIAFCLGAGPELSAADEAVANAQFEDFDDGITQTLDDQLSTDVIENYLRGKKPSANARGLRDRLQAAGVLDGNLQNHLIALLCRRWLMRRVPEAAAAGRHTERKVEMGFGAAAVRWVSQGNLFAAIVSKDEQPTVIVERLVEALKSWDPAPLHVMMVHAGATLEKAGSLAYPRVLETSRRQAGWLLRVLLGENEAERRAHIGELYGRLVNRLTAAVEPAVEGFGSRLIKPEEGLSPAALAKRMSGAPSNLGDEHAYHALNEHLCSDLCPDGPMTAGVVLRADRGTKPEFWLCTSPACDLIPGQNLKGWDKDLQPFRPISAARLDATKQFGKIMVTATHGRHIFLFVDEKAIALEVIDPQSHQMRLETLLLEADGVIHEGRVGAHLIELDGERAPRLTRVELKAIALLRPDYANRLLAESGQQRSRIGVDFVNLPPKPAA